MSIRFGACKMRRLNQALKQMKKPVARVFYISLVFSNVRRVLERFSIERRKTKTKVITLANHQSHKHYSKPIKTRSNYM